MPGIDPSAHEGLTNENRLKTLETDEKTAERVSWSSIKKGIGGSFNGRISEKER